MCIVINNLLEMSTITLSLFFKRMITNISFNIHNLQDNNLGSYVSTSKIMTNIPIADVFTFDAPCFLLRASD